MNDNFVETPMSNLKLLKCPLSIDNLNQITFLNLTSQLSYFNSLSNITQNKYSYIKRDKVIRFACNIDEIIDYNYCMFQNPYQNDKWYFAYITDMKYENQNLTYISIEIDSFQTWQFDITIKKSFVEREHVSDDYIGAHTLPEGLETGDYIINYEYIDTNLNGIISNLCYILSFPCELWKDTEHNDIMPPSGGGLYNGIYSGNTYYRYDDVNGVKSVINLITSCGYVDSINGLFLAPKILAPINENETIEYKRTQIIDSSTCQTYEITINPQNSLKTYTPKNKKLYTYPYNYLLISNNNGQTYTYNYEDFNLNNDIFSQNEIKFQVNMSLTPGCSIRLIPVYYKGSSYNNEYGINLGKFPTCNWQCDMYTNWLTKNSINTPVGMLTTDDIAEHKNNINNSIDFINAISSEKILNIVNATINPFYEKQKLLITKKQHNLIAPQVNGNLNCGDVITSMGKNTFSFYGMCIKPEYAKIIDDYFSVYGYLINEYKIPNIHTRTNWNYVKTVDINIIGDIPQIDMNNIKKMFNNGVTLWHNTSTFLDYSQENGVIS